MTRGIVLNECVSISLRYPNHDAATSELRQLNSRLAAVSSVAAVSVRAIQSPTLLVREHKLQKLTENLSD